MLMEVQTKVITVGGAGSESGGGVSQEGANCPRCSNDSPVRLEKTDPQANTCYRCRTCGHIFSPRD
jgi:predicted RNA-binding Zn-ribbon protein involved in translation (DUF1610 family)